MAHGNGVKARQTYVPLSRGLDDHLRKLSGNALKVYLHLLMNAGYSGPTKGVCECSLGQDRISSRAELRDRSPGDQKTRRAVRSGPSSQKPA